MPNTYAQTVALSCRECSQSFEAQLWRIVDVTERPDLLERVREGALHQLQCPHCGQDGQVDVPLLLFCPGQDPPILFSPAQGTSEEEDHERATQLVDRLRESLGAAWQDPWLHPGLRRVPRPMLPATLGDDPAAVAAGTQGSGPGVPHQFREDLSTANEAEGRYVKTGDQEYLDQATAAWQRVLNHPDFPGTDEQFQLAAIDNAGGSFLRRYWSRGQLADLDQTLSLWQRVVHAAPADSPERPGYLNNLGTGLSARYARSGSLQDLEDAIQAFQEAVAATPTDSPNRPGYVNNLGNGLRDRHARTGRPQDLENAIQAYQDAVAATPAGSPERPARLNNLGTGLRARHARTGSLQDLEDAIQAFQEAVAATPTGSPNRPSRLNNLGNGLRDRYACTDRPKDLEDAIQAFQDAVAATPAGSPQQPRHLNNLGLGLSERYACTDRPQDLEDAIQAFQDAVAATPAGSPQQPRHLNNLGLGLSARHTRTGSLQDLEDAIQAFRSACERGLAAAFDECLRGARNWGDWAWERVAWEEAGRAYAYGVQAADRLYRTQVSRSAREAWLSTAGDLHQRAAYAQARAGELEKAAVTLECGRARELGDVLARDRAVLEHLRQNHSDLALSFEDAAAAVRQFESAERAAGTVLNATGPAPRDAYAQASAAWDGFNRVVEAIREQEGYEDFLAQPDWEDVAGAVLPDQPLAYLALTPQGGLTLLLHRPVENPDQVTVEVLWADELTDAELRERLEGPPDDPALGGYLGAYLGWRQNPGSKQARIRWWEELEQMTGRLWPGLVGQLVIRLAELGYDRITLVAGGLLGLLPLHAAWIGVKGKQRHYALDDIAFSYAPSARALTHARRIQESAPDRPLLAVDEPGPYPEQPLPSSNAEVRAIAEHFGGGVETTVLSHEQATWERVKQALPGAGVVHFSCHGVNDWENPLDSGLLMAGEELLTGKDFFDLQLGAARLASLSACETGIPGAQLPDEVIGLPAALLQAGFGGVLASLWSVYDLSTAMLMERFYRLWRQEGLEPCEALRQAQLWVRDTTNREKSDCFGQDVSGQVVLSPTDPSTTKMGEGIASEFFGHVMTHSDGLDTRSFEHPVWWAAFYLTGV